MILKAAHSGIYWASWLKYPFSSQRSREQEDLAPRMRRKSHSRTHPVQRPLRWAQPRKQAVPTKVSAKLRRHYPASTVI
jgi:hypothetical protein